MGQSVFPAPTSKTAFRLTLLSGTTWTVPAGVTYVNVTLTGGGGGGSGNPIDTIAGTGGTTTFTGATSATGGTGGVTKRNGINSTTAGTGAYGDGGQDGYISSTSGADKAVYATRGNVVSSLVTGLTPGSTVSYAVGAGGSTTADSIRGGTGGQGKIDLEYWA
jgi:hypothetical protein